MTICNQCGKNISQKSIDSGKSKFFSDDDSRGATFILCPKCSTKYIMREQEYEREQEYAKKRKEEKAKQMREYNVNANLCIGSTTVFVNSVLKIPGVDFIFEDRSWYEGTYLIFRNKLNDNDTLCIQDSGLGEVFWFVVKEGELVDISNDKPNCDGTEWITL